MARLAAFDMDGTLLMPDHHLGRETIATLARLRERDITLTFATGRHVLEMRHILGTLSLDAYLITGNGTRIHSLEGDVLHRQDLDPQVADTVMHHAWDTRLQRLSLSGYRYKKHSGPSGDEDLFLRRS